VLGGVFTVFGPHPALAKALGLGLALATAWLTGSLAELWTGRRELGLLALVLTALAGPMLWGALSGMEVSLAALLVSQGAIEFSTSNAYARLDPRDVAVARTVGQIVALAFFAVVVLFGRPDPANAALTVVISYVVATLILLGRGLGQTLFTGRASKTPLAPVASEEPSNAPLSMVTLTSKPCSIRVSWM